jgi:hypothetical protein
MTFMYMKKQPLMAIVFGCVYDSDRNCCVNQHVHMYKDSLDVPILDVLRSGGTLKIDDNDLYDFEGTIIDWQELYANLYEYLTENNNDEDKN